MVDLLMVFILFVDFEVDYICGLEDVQFMFVEYIDFECFYCVYVMGFWEDFCSWFGDDFWYVVCQLLYYFYGFIVV